MQGAQFKSFTGSGGRASAFALAERPRVQQEGVIINLVQSESSLSAMEQGMDLTDPIRNGKRGLGTWDRTT